jgi:hypothetical protein
MIKNPVINGAFATSLLMQACPHNKLPGGEEMFGSEINHGYLLRASKNEADAAVYPAFATQSNSLQARS